MTTTLMTLGAILDDIAEQRPDEILLTTVMHSGNTETMSRGALRHSSDRMALALSEQGVTTGTLVPIHLPTCNQFLTAAVAILKAGGTPMPVSDRLPAAELAALLELADPCVIVSRNDADQTLFQQPVLNPDDFHGASPLQEPLP